MGGMQKHSYFLAKFLAKNKIYVDLFHYKDIHNSDLPDPFLEEELRYINLKEIAYPKTIWFPGHYLYKRFLYSKAICSKIIDSKIMYDFIYAKGFTAWSLLGKKSKYLNNTPLGVNFHGYEMFQRWPDFKTGLQLQILKLPVMYHMRKTDYLFSYGGKISKLIALKGYKNKIIEVPTGIDKSWIREEISPKNETLNFIFVGRAERRKGIVEINNVIKTLDSSLKVNFHFVGPIEDHLKSKDQRTVYHGPVYDAEVLKSILDKMDVLICPSHSEGMPNVIMEAMARGLAIIATDVGAVSKLVDEENGWLINPNGLEKNLNNSIVRAIKTECNEIDKKKKQSLNKIKFFTWEKVILQLINRIKSE